MYNDERLAIDDYDLNNLLDDNSAGTLAELLAMPYPERLDAAASAAEGCTVGIGEAAFALAVRRDDVETAIAIRKRYAEFFGWGSSMDEPSRFVLAGMRVTARKAEDFDDAVWFGDMEPKTIAEIEKMLPQRLRWMAPLASLVKDCTDGALGHKGAVPDENDNEWLDLVPVFDLRHCDIAVDAIKVEIAGGPDTDKMLEDVRSFVAGEALRIAARRLDDEGTEALDEFWEFLWDAFRREPTADFVRDMAAKYAQTD